MATNGFLLKETAKIRKIAFVGDHLPRKCGIATFTTDLLSAVQNEYPQSQCLCVSVNDIEDGYDYPEVVRFEIEEQDLPSYLRAADFLNISDVDIVCLQHEFGIFGGPAGGHILAMLRELKMPVVTTLHTILREPKPDQRRVIEELIALSTRLVVMADRGRQMLHEIYQAPLSKIDLIPHGILDVGSWIRPISKTSSRWKAAPCCLPSDCSHRIRASNMCSMPCRQFWRSFPMWCTSCLGATHPNELRRYGEAYRLSLEILATKNKLEKHVIFCNQFVDPENLKEFMGAADLYITPYLNAAQITSGTLSFAFGSGKAVVSTPYWHAADLLADGPGRAGAVCRFGGHGRADSWPAARRHTAQCHAQECLPARAGDDLVERSPALYAQLRTGSPGRRALVAKISRDQDARPETSRAAGAEADPSFPDDGFYRRLSACDLQCAQFQRGLLHRRQCPCLYSCGADRGTWPTMRRLERSLASTSAAFLHHAFDPASGRFHNHMSFDRRWLDEQGSEDSHGRALWALGVGVGRSPLRNFQMMAGQLFARALAGVDRVQLTASVGLRPAGHPRVPAPVRRRQPGEPGTRDADGAIDGALRPACACRLALV